MRKKLPVGIENFEEFSTEDFYYVDKTLFIRELLLNWGKVNLFTRPRRFGKSLNMSMLKCFFEVEADPVLFDGLKIMQEKELCEKYMGKFPVISISLKGVDGRDFESASAALRTIIGNEAARFRFLNSSDRLTDDEKESYAQAARFRFLNSSDRLTDDEKESYAQLTEVGASQGGIYTMTEKVAAASLKTLSQLLSRHFGQRVILLIDEYDVPLDKAFQSGYYDEMVSLMRNVLGNALKTNDSLYFAVLTGCLRISKESIFKGLNNLKVHTISDVRYDEYFGFTNSDVDELLEFYGLSTYKGVIRDWYDGYRFGDTDVYCPWDVINYCDELLADPIAPPKNYWANTSGNDLILRLLKKADQTTKDEVEELISNGKITQRIKQELTYRDIDDSVENVWSVLYAAGYLTGKHVEQADADIFSLWIPNGEICKLFSDLVQEAIALCHSDARNAGMEDDPRGLEEGGTGAKAYAEAVGVYLGLAVDRLAMTGNSLVRWNCVGQKAQHCFGRQSLPMLWDFAEPNFLGTATGSIDAAISCSFDFISCSFVSISF